MSESRIKRRWVDWNLYRKGRDRSPFENAKYAYRGVALFANDWPVGRLVPALNDDFVALARAGGGVAVTELQFGPNIVDCIQVEDLGVFSKFEGDMLDVDQLHERMKWLFNAEAADIIERASSIPESVLVKADPYYHGSAKRLTNSMSSVVNLYDRYRMAFGLKKWLAFPPNYTDRLAAIIDARSKRYHSPEEEAKRVRKYAREEAKKALGLANDDD